MGGALGVGGDREASMHSNRLPTEHPKRQSPHDVRQDEHPKLTTDPLRDQARHNLAVPTPFPNLPQNKMQFSEGEALSVSRLGGCGQLPKCRAPAAVCIQPSSAAMWLSAFSLPAPRCGSRESAAGGRDSAAGPGLRRSILCTVSSEGPVVCVAATAALLFVCKRRSG